MKHINKVGLILVTVSFLIVTYFYNSYFNELKQQIAQVKSKQFTLMKDYHKCLEEQHKSVKKQLFSSYLNSVIELNNKIDSDLTITEEEIKSFDEKHHFLIENLSLLNLSNNEVKVYINFMITIKNKLKENKEKKK